MKVVEFDSVEYRNSIVVFSKELGLATERGMERAMRKFMKDVLDEPPSCPMRSGDLYDSHEYSIIRRKDSVEGTLTAGKGLAYAATLHEGIHPQTGLPFQNYTRPGSGPHWISSKVLQYGNGYAKIAANEIEKQLGRFHKK